MSFKQNREDDKETIKWEREKVNHMTPIATHLRSLAADLLKAADHYEALEREKTYLQGMCSRLTKLVPTETVSYADKTEISLFEGTE